MSNIEVIVLGSGTRVLLPDRSMSGYAVIAPDFFIMLDCGGGAIRRGLEAGLSMLAVDAILISHLHLDHIADLPAFLWSLHGEGKERASRPLYLFGPPGFRNFFIGLVNLFGDWINDIVAPTKVREVNEEKLSLGPWRVEVFSMKHGVPANGYRLESQGKTLAYTGDTGPCDAAVALARGADLLIAECSLPAGEKMPTHLNAAEVGQLATAANCRCVLLSHLYPESLAVDAVAQCREFFAGKVELSHDLKRLILS